ncbi:MAG TPA: type VI secretion system baseplate subunit TssG [Candidatus Dormibacteraeota bacterium]|nr:type VI secretion system baseplate subunit TssG [Candidatus Dormibacteraeota bacterium]
MAGSNGQTPDSLIAQLAAEPQSFDFYTAIRLLQSRFDKKPRIGHSWSPKDDPVRFAQNPNLGFAPSTIEAVVQKTPERPPTIYTRQFGLFGPNGPLPLCLTEYAYERIRHHNDRTFAEFANVFHHRLLSFFFRAWADAHKTVDFDRPTEQSWSDFVGSLIGLGMESLRARDSVPDRAKLYFAGRLVQQTRNAEGLAAIIQDFFRVHTDVLTFMGRWLVLPKGSACELGDSRATGSLGATIIVGSRFWTAQLHFRLRMGPMKLADYERLLPTGGSFRRLCDWIREYTGEHYSWDAQLVLAKEEVPSIQIGRAGKLGWTTWLKTKPFDHDAEDLVLQPVAAV